MARATAKQKKVLAAKKKSAAVRKVEADKRKKAADAKKKEVAALKLKKAEERKLELEKKKLEALRLAAQKKRIKELEAKPSLNTGDIIDKIALSHNLTKVDAKEIVNSFLDTIQTQVKKGKSVHLTGFGVFERVNRKARTGRNPQTGDKVKIPAKKLPSFRPGMPFKALVEPKVFGKAS